MQSLANEMGLDGDVQGVEVEIGQKCGKVQKISGLHINLDGRDAFRVSRSFCCSIMHSDLRFCIPVECA